LRCGGHAIHVADYIAAGDVDGDGDLDLIGGRGGMGNWHLAANGDSEVFANVNIFPRSSDQLDGGVIADLDEDGYGDLVLSMLKTNNVEHRNRPVCWGAAHMELSWDDCTVLTDADGNDLTGGFLQPPLIADLDGDGALDILHLNFRGDAYYCYGDGARGFDCVEYQRFSSGGEPRAGDVDGDGDQDFVHQSDDALHTCRNRHADGQPRQWECTTQATPGYKMGGSAPLADYDGDGDLDWVSSLLHGSPNSHQVAQFCANDGAGNWSCEGFGEVGPMAMGIDAADWDGDGDLDVAVALRRGDLLLCVNDGAASFTCERAGLTDRANRVRFHDFGAPPAERFCDSDGDLVEDGQDNCPFHHNPGQEDADGDRTGDACDD